MIVRPVAVSILLLGAGAAIVTPRHAAAGVLDAAALTTGAPSASAGLFTLTAGPSGGVLDRKTTLGVSGIGVSGPGSMVAGEIDSGESITLHATSPQRLNGFSLAYLFAAGAQGDVLNEMAMVDVVLGGTRVATFGLTANQGGGADLTGAPGGVVTTISPGIGDGGGAFAVSGLDVAFTDLVFRPGNGGGMAADGDFSLMGLSYDTVLFASEAVMVPEPGSLAGFGVGLFSWACWRRRRPA